MAMSDAWIKERCKIGTGQYELVSVLFADWKQFAASNGTPAGSVIRFSKHLQKAGFQRVINPSKGLGSGFHGIAVAGVQ